SMTAHRMVGPQLERQAMKECHGRWTHYAAPESGWQSKRYRLNRLAGPESARIPASHLPSQALERCNDRTGLARPVPFFCLCETYSAAGVVASAPLVAGAGCRGCLWGCLFPVVPTL